MDHKTAKTILDIRKIFHIPLEGFETYKEALDWYKEHYRIHKKRIFNLRLWYKFDDTGRLLEYDFIKKSKGFYLPAIPKLDKDVPLDKTITDLITDSGMEEWKGPAMRVIVLTARNLSSSGIPPIPEWLSVEVFGLRLLLSRKDLKSSREWRKLGEHSGFVKPGKNRGIVQGDLIIGYDKRRNWGKKEEEYQDVFWAYLEVLKDREKARLEGKGRKGRRGINIEIGNKLVERFGWEKWKIDSYIISRYLKRAKMRWYAPDLE